MSAKPFAVVTGASSGIGRELGQARVDRTIAGMTAPLRDDEIAFLLEIVDLARQGQTEQLADAVDRGVPVNLTNGSGDSLLMLAAYHGHPATVRMLLARGADTERINDRGQTALGAAVFRQSADIVRDLLAAGADPDGGGRSAREFAEFFRLDAMGQLLRDGPTAQ